MNEGRKRQRAAKGGGGLRADERGLDGNWKE